MSYQYRDEPSALPPYIQLRLAHAKEDLAAKVSSPYLEKLLNVELLTVRRLLEDAERQQSMELAKEALSYTQDVLYKAEHLPPLKVGRNSRAR